MDKELELILLEFMRLVITDSRNAGEIIDLEKRIAARKKSVTTGMYFP